MRDWWYRSDERFGVVDGQGLDVDEVAVSSKGSSSSSSPQRFVSVFGTGISYGGGGGAAAAEQQPWCFPEAVAVAVSVVCGAAAVVFSWGGGCSGVSGVRSSSRGVCERERERERVIDKKTSLGRVYVQRKKKKKVQQKK